MNSLLDTGHIDLWVLVLGLFLPRLALFIAWMEVTPYPTNPLPDLVDFVLWLFLPRFLMAYDIYLDIGSNNLWFWAYLVMGIAGALGESGYVRHRIVRRTTTSRDGRTTTTVEEEEV